MKRSKLVAVTMLCALFFCACVDDKESETVTELRKAKTEYFTAQAAYETARAQAERVTASIAEKKAEAEIEVMKLKATAKAALTEAQARQAAAEAERLEKQLEFDLKNMQLEAEKREAEYKKELQNYLNSLAAAKFETVEDYQEALATVDRTKGEIRDKELELLKAQRERAAGLAGKAEANVKKQIINAQVVLAQAERDLKEYEMLHAASAQDRETQIEEIRAGLEELVEQVGEAKLAKERAEAGIEAVNVDELRSELTEAWEVLAGAESGSREVEVEGEIVPVEVKGHGNVIDASDLLNVKYYEWEAKRLCEDIAAVLAKEEKNLAPLADTVSKLAPILEDLYGKLTVAETKHKDAVAAEDAAQKAYDKATGEAKTEAGKKLDTAKKARIDAKTAYDKALAAYTEYRVGMDAVKAEYQAQAKVVAAYTIFLNETQEATATCFNGAYAEAVENVKGLQKEYEEAWETYQELNMKYQEDKDLVVMWDDYKNRNSSGVSDGDPFLAQVEKRILDLQADVKEAEAKLADLEEILADPERIAEDYDKFLGYEMQNVEEDLARLNVRLEQEQMVADSYKAVIDAWMAE